MSLPNFLTLVCHLDGARLQVWKDGMALWAFCMLAAWCTHRVALDAGQMNSSLMFRGRQITLTSLKDVSCLTLHSSQKACLSSTKCHCIA